MAESGTAPRTREFGDGILFRLCRQVYAVGAITVGLAVGALPLIIVSITAVRDLSNAVIFGAAAIPLGPAWAAALYALRRLRDETDTGPVRDFARGLRLNTREVLAGWLPGLAILTVLTLDLGYLSAGRTTVDRLLFWPVFGVAVLVALLLGTFLIIVSRYRFRLRDAVRIALHLILRKPMVSLGQIAIMIIAAGLTVLFTDAALVLAGGCLAYLAVLNGRPLERAIEDSYLQPDERR